MSLCRVAAAASLCTAFFAGCSSISERLELPTVVCSGHMRLDLPANWTLVESARGTEARSAANEKFEIVTLERPRDDQAISPPPARETLREFVALKTKTVESITKDRYWPFADFDLPTDMPTMAVALLYPDQGQSIYTVQYLVAEPGVIHMITFDKNGVADGYDVESDRRKFDSIVRTVTWGSVALNAGSPQCH